MNNLTSQELAAFYIISANEDREGLGFVIKGGAQLKPIWGLGPQNFQVVNFLGCKYSELGFFGCFFFF